MYRVVKIQKVLDEAKAIKTFLFEDSSEPTPGQFYMVWLPGIDEFPMSISYIGALKGFTVKKIGYGTSKMHELGAGSKLWIRGPYGKGFSHVEGKALVVGGGSGMATLAPLIERLDAPDIVIGARTKEELLFVERFKDLTPYLATDDGSAGFHGYAPQLAERLVNENKYDIIYACGPELMLKPLIELAKQRHIEIQASLERLMKCGIGICDSCSINGYRVCVDGPVFSSQALFSMSDLGKVRRDASGNKEVLS